MLYLRLFIFFFTSLLFIFKNSYSQDTNTIKYLPLAVGNTWVYYYTTSSFQGNGSGYEIYKITGTSAVNGKIFFNIQKSEVVINGTFFCAPRLFSGSVRVDSFNCNIYSLTNCNSNTMILVDSLHSKLRDTAVLCTQYQEKNDVCQDTSAYSIFGQQIAAKRFVHDFFEGGEVQTYSKNIGMVYYNYNLGSGTCWLNLRGCIINGQLYGDTSTLSGINQISGVIPKSFSLSQNYPNPFNPSTKIKFEVTPPQPLPEGEGRYANSPFVTLKIYDALGREVATLVNELLKPGTYEVEWDASDFPSGVYFYKLEAGNFNQTKKLVLIK